MPNLLIIGANSAIAEHYARLEAKHGSRMALLGRSRLKLDALRQDLRVRGCTDSISITLDVNDFDTHGAALEQARDFLGEIDVILIAHGVLPIQSECESDPKTLRAMLETNAISTISLMMQGAVLLRAQQSGTLAVVSSVAGDRGRASNFAYGSAKAAVSSFASGLRQSMHQHNVNILTINPGFVDTPMTHEFRKSALWSKPDVIAKGIQASIRRKRGVVYLPWFWRPIMSVIRHIPEFVFRRIRL